MQVDMVFNFCMMEGNYMLILSVIVLLEGLIGKLLCHVITVECTEGHQLVSIHASNISVHECHYHPDQLL